MGARIDGGWALPHMAPAPSPDSRGGGGGGGGDGADAARAILAVRQRLGASLPGGFLYDPVFDILLTLYVADAERRVLRQEDMCRSGYAAPNSTRRWITALLDEGLIREEAEHYGLTERAREMLERALKQHPDLRRALRLHADDPPDAARRGRM